MQRSWRSMLGAVLAGAALASGAAAESRHGRSAEIAAFRHAPLTPGALRAHVEQLASDAFEGRAPATRGEALTVDYIARAFAQAGLAPGGDPIGDGARDWRQRVPLASATVINQPLLAVAGADGMRAYASDQDLIVWSKRREPHIALDRAELVFVGYGIVSPQLGWNDYAGVDMTGKIALILINDPDCETGDDRGFGGDRMTYFGRLDYKIEEAARHNAAGALVIHESGPAGFSWDAVRSTWSGPQLDIVRGDNGAGRPALEGWLRRDAAVDLLSRAGVDFETEKHRAQRPDFSPRRLGLFASISIDNRLEQIVSNNVVGLLGGRERHDEAIVYTAHWDHLGRCPPVDHDDICNGAVDNASGVAGLIELARRFANAGRTQRSIIFVATTAEESGLLGAAHYVRHANIEPARIAAAINLDMLNVSGPARDVIVFGDGQNDLDMLLAQAAAQHGRVFRPDPFPERGAFFRSDQLAFAEAGVPVLYAAGGFDLYTGGEARGRALNALYMVEHYHKPSDELTADWDLTGAFQDLLLLYEVGDRLANSGAWPAWRDGSAFKPIRDASRADRAP
jgi:Zn-dependent M28 family amino/carboxypeptidase